MPAKRILIVEDDQSLQQALREMLGLLGYEVLEAVDGAQGLARAATLQPDVILLDVRMPGMDGYEVCRRLKGDLATSAIPVVFLTAVEDRALNRLAYEAGAVACVTKPFRREALLAVIEAALASAWRQASHSSGSESPPAVA